jgi:hypothetical protein
MDAPGTYRLLDCLPASLPGAFNVNQHTKRDSFFGMRELLAV